MTCPAAATIRLALNKVPQIWKDGHVALAAGYDGGTGRYVGLWTPADNASPPVATDSLLLVRPDVAMRQIAATEPPMPRVTDPGDETSPAGATPEPSSALGRRVVDIMPNREDPLLRSQDSQQLNAGRQASPAGLNGG